MSAIRIDVDENKQPTADILDWCGPFAARVMSRIHEYDDGWPKPRYVDTVIRLDARRARSRSRTLQGGGDRQR